MKTKEEVIKEAWDGHKANYNIETGWAFTYVSNGINDFPQEMQERFDIEYVEQDIMRYRPKSLQGIENNNGWIKIKSDDWLKNEKINEGLTRYYINTIDEDYLTIAIMVEGANDKEIITIDEYLFIKEQLESSGVFAVAYQPIEKPKSSIY